ncbi:hypothetical protein OUZ56_016949 [Daphnia magna]|uniref:Uncharacterized protein n=1 Tax=Daphnia magna TaxID=35525 RepID=A0ABR0AS70_9CRUS|nr:hypothetical protein OUZ56_016949 [Daphnia magna]
MLDLGRQSQRTLQMGTSRLSITDKGRHRINGCIASMTMKECHGKWYQVADLKTPKKMDDGLSNTSPRLSLDRGAAKLVGNEMLGKGAKTAERKLCASAH